MEAWAEENEFPIIGPNVGNLLYQITFISRAAKILELGSGFGYSAYWFAKALPENGYVQMTEHSRENIEIADEFLKQVGFENKVRIEQCDSLEFIAGSSEEYDIIFNDIDKEFYPGVVESAYAKLKTGGILISDNVLWHGRVISSDDSDATIGVREFTGKLLSHQGFHTVIIPMRDGVSISRKL